MERGSRIETIQMLKVPRNADKIRSYAKCGYAHLNLLLSAAISVQLLLKNISLSQNQTLGIVHKDPSPPSESMCTLLVFQFLGGPEINARSARAWSCRATIARAKCQTSKASCFGLHTDQRQDRRPETIGNMSWTR